MNESWKEKMSIIAMALEKNDGCGAQMLSQAKDYLIEASSKLNSLRPTHDCASCSHFRLLDCALAPGKMPPPDIVKNGCEMWNDAFEIPWS